MIWCPCTSFATDIFSFRDALWFVFSLISHYVWHKSLIDLMHMLIAAFYGTKRCTWAQLRTLCLKPGDVSWCPMLVLFVISDTSMSFFLSFLPISFFPLGISPTFFPFYSPLCHSFFLHFRYWLISPHFLLSLFKYLFPHSFLVFVPSLSLCSGLYLFKFSLFFFSLFSHSGFFVVVVHHASVFSFVSRELWFVIFNLPFAVSNDCQNELSQINPYISEPKLQLHPG